jgi:hypothetical protein
MGNNLLLLLREFGLHPVGERSCKLSAGKANCRRWLLGIPRSALSPEQLNVLLTRMGFPPQMQSDFYQRLEHASEIQIAVEEASERTLLKLYLERWPQLAQAVGRGNCAPQLLNFGYKWIDNQPESLITNAYICWPMLSHAEIVARIRPLASGPVESVIELVNRVVAETPDRSLIYLEINDASRRSFDLNLYRCAWTLKQASPCIMQIAEEMDSDLDAVVATLEQHANLPLGHISAGSDGNGAPFFTFYYEAGAL